MELVIGAPVFQRAWVLDEWFSHLAGQGLPHDLQVRDVTILLNDGGSSDGTLDIIDEWDERVGWSVEVIDSSDHGEHVASRAWSGKRYSLMADLRNQLLARVRELRPTYYWSHDTDILAPPETLMTLLEGQGRFDGTAPTVYMTEHSTLHPNSMRFIHGDRVRRTVPKGPDFWRVGVAFASVLMNKELYAVDYAGHEQGEDIGWGLNARRAGLTFGVHPGCKCKHVMTLSQLGRVDHRVGF